MDIAIDLNALAWIVGWGIVFLIVACAIITINQEVEEKKQHDDAHKLPDQKSADNPIS